MRHGEALELVKMVSKFHRTVSVQPSEAGFRRRSHQEAGALIA
jgi:hypothetical protein